MILVLSHATISSTFYEGLAVVRIGGKWGYIDRTGKYVINPQFDSAFPFFEGYFDPEDKPPIVGVILGTGYQAWKIAD
jgi:hypothetical protein